MRLREISGLPVAMLAQLAGVSRVTYHNWLKGEGISETNISRLAGLLEALRELREIRSEELGEFLETPGELGSPIELLQHGDTDAVLGLALRPANTVASPPVVADDIWTVSGLEGWIRPTVSLNWGAPRLTDAELERVLLGANPRPWMGEDIVIDKSDESPFVAHVQFVS